MSDEKRQRDDWPGDDHFRRDRARDERRFAEEEMVALDSPRKPTQPDQWPVDCGVVIANKQQQ